MFIIKKCIIFLIAVCMLLALSSCNPVDKNFGVNSDPSSPSSLSSIVKKADDNIKRPKIMSSDKTMAKFIDISVFDEENYSQIYLGKRFKFNIEYGNDDIKVPTNLSSLTRAGWKLIESEEHGEDSLIYACEQVDAVFQNQKGNKIKALFYNSSNSSVKLKNCNIVKFRIENDFYKSPEKYTEFNINGVNNKMAITDVIDSLGTPSHFYAYTPNEYYLDYFITEDDRRNGITVYINIIDDSVTAVEFSYFK